MEGRDVEGDRRSVVPFRGRNGRDRRDAAHRFGRPVAQRDPGENGAAAGADPWNSDGPVLAQPWQLRCDPLHDLDRHPSGHHPEGLVPLAAGGDGNRVRTENGGVLLSSSLTAWGRSPCKEYRPPRTVRCAPPDPCHDGGIGSPQVTAQTATMGTATRERVAERIHSWPSSSSNPAANALPS